MSTKGDMNHESDTQRPEAKKCWIFMRIFYSIDEEMLYIHQHQILQDIIKYLQHINRLKYNLEFYLFYHNNINWIKYIMIHLVKYYLMHYFLLYNMIYLIQY